MEEICQLQCKICQKLFPKYDQRGFRNAGFTAHQNKCIEKDYLLNNPVSEKQLSPKQRLILPAPPAPPSSTSSSTHIALSTSSPPSISATVKKNMSIQQHQYQAPPQDRFVYDGALFYTVDSSWPENFDISLFSPSFSRTYNNETIYPITHCEHCNPESGLHQLSCRLPARLFHDQRTPR